MTIRTKSTVAATCLVLCVMPIASVVQAADVFECIFEPKTTINLGSPSDGLLEAVLVDRGDRIRKGQVLARLTSGVEKANVSLSKARLEFSELKLERNKDMAARNLIPEIELDEMKTEYEINRYSLRKDEELLRMRYVRSPINGVVVERDLSPGEQVRQDQARIMKIAQIDPLNVEVVIPARLYGSIKVGMQASIRLEASAESMYTAKVSVVDRVVDAASDTFGVRLALPNPGYKIPAGFKCRAEFLAEK